MKKIIAYKGYYTEFMAKLSEQESHGKIVGTGEEEDSKGSVAV